MTPTNQNNAPEVAFPIPKGAHLNGMGGPSYFLSDPVRALRLAASSSFFGEPQYYNRDADVVTSARRTAGRKLSDAELTHLRATLQALDPQEWRGLSPSALMERAIDAALAYDAEATLQEAVRLRQEDHVRLTPQVILVRAANTSRVKGTGLVARYAPQIIRRADEPAAGLAYQLAAFGKPIPNSLKRAWAAALRGLDTYQLAKYRQGSRSMRAADVVSLTHAHSAPVDALMKDTLRTTDGTWEAVLSAEGSTRETWEKALPLMGHMALLRNLRNLIRKGIPVEQFGPQLLAGVKSGKQLPFRYYSAYRAVRRLARAHVSPEGVEIVPATPPEVLQPVYDVLERCLQTSLENTPYFGGRVMSLCDNSGSAWGTATSSMGTMHIAQIANLTAQITGMRSREGYVGVFGDRLETVPVNKHASVFEAVENLDTIGKGVGGGTENGVWLFWDKAIREREKWDAVFVYSDMQAGHGGLFGTDKKQYRDYVWEGGERSGMAYIDVPKLIQTYRHKVNPNVMVYLMQVAGYSDTIMPEFYDRTFILGGWGEGLLRFASQMTELYSKRDQNAG